MVYEKWNGDKIIGISYENDIFRLEVIIELNMILLNFDNATYQTIPVFGRSFNFLEWELISWNSEWYVI